ncbi:MAG TPA: A/G-specific adenine glycosylase [Aestuariivirgaceae bacterium]|nr:A/G-specific adenine glycosylase [Aestuariivirgaceae bacterium]
MTRVNPAARSQGRDAAALLAWYDRHRRRLPWRAEPGEFPDPYRVWLSEIMLQQTTAVAVAPYFLSFVERWPSVEALAAASLDNVLGAWAGLGYYARARNLHACARAIAGDLGGRFPDTEAGLRDLPGIGPYTAGAIAAIAFGRRAAAVDGNAERVIARLDAIETALPQAKRVIHDRVLELVPADRPGDFAQALMDLGATICTPRAPACGVCPWTGQCEGRRRGIAEMLPRKARKRQRPTRHGAAFWVERADGAVLMRRRENKGLLGGMIEVPSSDWTAAGPADVAAAAPVPAQWRALGGKVEHTFTHFHLVLTVWRADAACDGLPTSGDYRWVAPEALDAQALPSLMKKVVAEALRAR